VLKPPKKYKDLICGVCGWDTTPRACARTSATDRPLGTSLGVKPAPRGSQSLTRCTDTRRYPVRVALYLLGRVDPVLVVAEHPEGNIVTILSYSSTHPGN